VIQPLITAATVATLLNCGEKRARRLMKSGAIVSKEDSGRWYTTEAAVERYLATPDVERKPEPTPTTGRPWGVLRSTKTATPRKMETAAERDARRKAEGKYVYGPR
jgi:hypothetical protein